RHPEGAADSGGPRLRPADQSETDREPDPRWSDSGYQLRAVRGAPSRSDLGCASEREHRSVQDGRLARGPADPGAHHRAAVRAVVDRCARGGRAGERGDRGRDRERVLQRDGQADPNAADDAGECARCAGGIVFDEGFDMQPFEWVDATSVEQAAALMATTSATHPVVAKAGGIDLIDLMKEGIVRPARVINLRSIPGLDDIAVDDRGLVLGALVTLARIERAAEIRPWYPALAAAAAHASTPQIRNAATIGGNLLQRPRCWYFRNELFHHDGMDVNAIVRDGE